MMLPPFMRSAPVCLVVGLLAAHRGAAQPGSLDPTFNAGTNIGAIFSVAVQLDGKILIGGAPTAGRDSITFARLLPDGSADPGFHTGAGVDGFVRRIVVQDDGHILIAGGFTRYDGVASPGVARLNPDGTFDASFTAGTGANGSVHGLAVQTDGRVIIGGDFLAVDGIARNQTARLFSDRLVDLSFAGPELAFVPGGPQAPGIFDLLLMPDGQVIVAGAFGSIGGVEQSSVARLQADGSLDTSFVPAFFSSTVYSLARQRDGRILATGDFWARPSVNLARLHPDGSLDEGFNPQLCCASDDPVGVAVAVQEDGRILYAGTSYPPGTYPPQTGLNRLNADGSLDPTFQAGAGFELEGYVQAIALQADGKVLIGGGFITVNGVPRIGIARLNNDPAPGFIQFLSRHFRVLEEFGPATFTVRRTGGSLGAVSVHYEVRAGTAKPGQDFQPRSGRIVFADGETVKTISVSVGDDALVEGDETIQLLLSHPRGGAQLADPAEAVLTIGENDREPD
ncbi:MAG TPA: Calx-beta domain-containing protein [Verrucomicrobiae bacterium]|nr:Calx-beta domain-containing protein [Verrucomicrobiae bacterium]